MKVEFRLEIDPPTATAQEKQVRVVCGHPQFYEKPAAKEAKKLLIAEREKNVKALTDFKKHLNKVKAQS